MKSTSSSGRSSSSDSDYSDSPTSLSSAVSASDSDSDDEEPQRMHDNRGLASKLMRYFPPKKEHYLYYLDEDDEPQEPEPSLPQPPTPVLPKAKDNAKEQKQRGKKKKKKKKKKKEEEGSPIVESGRIHLPTELTSRSWNSSFQKMYDVLGLLGHMHHKMMNVEAPDDAHDLYGMVHEGDAMAQPEWTSSSIPEDETLQFVEDSIIESLDDIASLYQGFVETVTLYAKLIVSERFLPNSLKTLKPCNDVGGIAGGSKYKAEGILFKFNDDPHGIYGGVSNAAKSAGHELKGFSQLQALVIPGLCFPMFVIIDYRGFRVSATTMLPLSNRTLRCGSADGGKTVVNSDPQLTRLLSVAGDLLGLKPHLAGACKGRGQVLPLAIDVEGHSGTDGRYYVIDTSRLMPPEKPITKGAFLYRFLRPELVRSYPRKLCSDAMSKFIVWDPLREQHNDEVRDATRLLLKKVIPTFAAWLSSHKELPLGFNLTTMMHKQGINMRYLGLLCESIHSNWRSQLVTEMIFRAAKGTIRVLMRRAMELVKLPADGPCKQAVCEYLNLLVGNSEEATRYRAKELHATVWDSFFSHRMMSESDWQVGSPIQNASPFDLQLELEKNLLKEDILAHIIERTGITLKKNWTPKRLLLPRPIKKSDILALEPTHKYMKIAELARVFSQSHKYHLVQWDTEKGPAKACKLFEAIEELSKDSWRIVYFGAKAAFSLWKKEADPALQEYYKPLDMTTRWKDMDILYMMAIADEQYLLRGTRTQHPRFHSILLRWAKECATLAFDKMSDCLLALVASCLKLHDQALLSERQGEIERVVRECMLVPSERKEELLSIINRSRTEKGVNVQVAEEWFLRVRSTLGTGS